MSVSFSSYDKMFQNTTCSCSFFTQSERHKFLSGSGVVVEFVLFDAILVHLSSGGLFFSGPRILLVVVDTVLGDDWGKYV